MYHLPRTSIVDYGCFKEWDEWLMKLVQMTFRHVLIIIMGSAVTASNGRPPTPLSAVPNTAAVTIAPTPAFAVPAVAPVTGAPSASYVVQPGLPVERLHWKCASRMKHGLMRTSSCRPVHDNNEKWGKIDGSSMPLLPP